MPGRKHLPTIHRLEEIPQFACEAEEHAFWAKHELSDELWEEAEPLQPGELPPARTETTPVVIRLDGSTLRRIKALARRRRTGYQALLQNLVTECLEEEERRTGLR